MSLLISDAVAQATTAAGQSPVGGAFGSIIMLAGFILIFYFLLWRPQSKRAKDHKQLIAGLDNGDEIVTNGGVLGKVTRITDDFLSLKIAENVEVQIQRSAVAMALPKGTIKSAAG